MVRSTRARLLPLAFALFALWQVPSALGRLVQRARAAPAADRWAALTLTPAARLERGLAELHGAHRAVIEHVPADGNVLVSYRPRELTPSAAVAIEARFRQPLVSLLAPRRVLLLVQAGSASVFVPPDPETYLGREPFHLLEVETLVGHPWEEQATVIAEGPHFRLWSVRSL